SRWIIRSSAAGARRWCGCGRQKVSAADLQTDNKSFFVARARENQPLFAVGQRDQADRRVGEERQQFVVGQGTRLSGGNKLCRGQRCLDGWRVRFFQFQRQNGHSRHQSQCKTARCRAPVTPTAENPAARKQSGITAAFVAEQILNQLLFLRFHGTVSG